MKEVSNILLSENSLKRDYIFKEVFSKPGNEYLLKEFLEDILDINITKITIMKDVSLAKLNKNAKLGILDLKAEINDNLIIDIEMQVEKNSNIMKRLKFYASNLFISSVKNKNDYITAKDVIVICICDFIVFKDVTSYMSETVTVLNTDKEKEISNEVKLVIVELPKFRKIQEDKSKKADWFALIDNTNEGRVNESMAKNKSIQDVCYEIKYLTGDEEVARMNELREKYDLDMNSAKKMSFNEGLKKGQIRGHIKGRKEGRIELINEIKKLNLDENSMKQILELA